MSTDPQTRKRGGHRAQATSLIKKAETECQKDAPSIELLQGYAQELVRQKDILITLDDTIQEKIADQDILCADIQDSSDRLVHINLALNHIERIIANSQITNKEDRQNHPKQSVKLPQLTLNKFGGDPLDWLNFWDLFKTSVHDRQDLPTPVKFQYLVGQLHDEAKNLVAGFNLTTAEYDEAIDLGPDASWANLSIKLRNL